VESSERRIDLIDPSLSIRDNNTMPNMVQVVRVSVRPEKVDEYLALAKSISYPAYKKAGVKRRTFARVRLGGPSSDFVTSIGMDKWADMDEPSALQKSLGEKGYKDFVAKLSNMIYRSQFDVYRYLPDASYVPSR
jgi:quinol monooxygenase YgiN